MSATTDDDNDECISEAEAERIKLLARVSAIDHERDAIIAADPWAPDGGPLLERYEELCDALRDAARDLCRAGPPQTVRATKVLARMVLERSPRRRRDGTLESDDFSSWLELAVIVGASGQREQIGPTPDLRKWLGEAEKETQREPTEAPA